MNFSWLSLDSMELTMNEFDPDRIWMAWLGIGEVVWLVLIDSPNSFDRIGLDESSDRVLHSLAV